MTYDDGGPAELSNAKRLKHAASFRELVVYQRALGLARDIFVLTKGWPREEAFVLTGQIRRASRSIGAQLAEGWARRYYERSFVAKLLEADGE